MAGGEKFAAPPAEHRLYGGLRLSHLRYGGGATSYLEVLTNDTNYFSAELGLVQAQLNERLALVQLYKGLGGGMGGSDLIVIRTCEEAPSRAAFLWMRRLCWPSSL